MFFLASEKKCFYNVALSSVLSSAYFLELLTVVHQFCSSDTYILMLDDDLHFGIEYNVNETEGERLSVQPTLKGRAV